MAYGMRASTERRALNGVNTSWCSLSRDPFTAIQDRKKKTKATICHHGATRRAGTRCRMQAPPVMHFIEITTRRLPKGAELTWSYFIFTFIVISIRSNHITNPRSSSRFPYWNHYETSIETKTSNHRTTNLAHDKHWQLWTTLFILP